MCTAPKNKTRTCLNCKLMPSFIEIEIKKRHRLPCISFLFEKFKFENQTEGDHGQ